MPQGNGDGSPDADATVSVHYPHRNVRINTLFWQHRSRSRAPGSSWTIVTCKCGDRWPCHLVKHHLRHHHGWTVDITDHLNDLTKRLPKTTTRLRRLWRTVTRRPRTGQL